MSEKTEDAELLPAGCSLWVGWLFASIVGTGLGWLIGWRVSFIAPGVISTVTIGLTSGLTLGFLQWLVLRGHLTGAGWWVLASALGWAAGFPIGVMLAQRLALSETGFGVVVGLVTGVFLGVFQWIVLRKQVQRAGWWIPASIFAWGSAMVYYRPGITGVGFLFGTLCGIVTGMVLLWLFYRPDA